MTESLTKEERIQLSTRWPPDTKLYLKLLRVHDELSAQSTELNASYDRMCLAVLMADEMLKKERAKVLSGQEYARSLMGDSNDSCMSEDIARGFLEAIK